MPVSLPDKGFIVKLVYFGTFLDFAIPCSQPHRTSFLSDSFLLFHQIDNRVFGPFVHFGGMGIFIPQYISCKFNHSTLHPKAYPKERDLLLTSIPGSKYFPVNAPVSESRSHNNPMLFCKDIIYIILGDLFRMNTGYFYFAPVGSSCMAQ